MVSRKELVKQNTELQAEISSLKGDMASLKETCDRLLKAIYSLNKKVNKHIKEESASNEENDRIQEWLTDERIEEVQPFLHKGVK